MQEKLRGAKFRQKFSKKQKLKIKQLRNTLNVKATPMPSFYYGVERESDQNKTLQQGIARNIKPRRAQTKCLSSSSISGRSRARSSTAGTKVCAGPKTIIDQIQATEATSCHSKITSDNSPRPLLQKQ